MRGAPSRGSDTFHGSRRIWRVVEGLAVVLAGAAAGYGRDRSGRSPGVPCAAADAPGGLPPKGRGEKLPPRNGQTLQGEPRPPTAGHPGRSSPLCSRPFSLFTAWPVRLGAPEVRP
jgi:hypothetical protein